MTTQTALVTVEEFQRLPPPEYGVKRELVEGEIVEMSTARGGHEKVKARFNSHLVLYAAAHPGIVVLVETRFVLGERSDVIPDLTVVREADFLATDPDDYFRRPLIAVEVVSSESASRLEAKTRAYLAHGAQAVIIAYPDERAIHVRVGDSAHVLGANDYLELPDVLPGFRVQVAEFFRGV